MSLPYYLSVQGKPYMQDCFKGGGNLKLLYKKHQSCLKFKHKNYQNVSRIEENMKDQILLIESSVPANRQSSLD